MRHSAEMSRPFPRFVAYLHTSQICGVCRGVKVGIRGLLNWTAENLFLAMVCCVKDQSCYFPVCHVAVYWERLISAKSGPLSKHLLYNVSKRLGLSKRIKMSSCVASDHLNVYTTSVYARCTNVLFLYMGCIVYRFLLIFMILY
jgi:hypothetical protein